VTFYDSADALNAISLLNGRPFHGRTLHLQEAKARIQMQPGMPEVDAYVR
jgi:RNA recognition motif-containing protein